jgi:DNA polymerase I-like protein with 3'-5' exonuclease and polymerase domains
MPPPLLACDIETEKGMIKCIGFARSRYNACVVPFIDWKSPTGSYWPDTTAELAAWELCERLLTSPSIAIVGQNFLYDLQYITRAGIRPARCEEDTMLRHHSLFPELQKGLGFLGSIYTNEASWKLLRKHKADEPEKKDE